MLFRSFCITIELGAGCTGCAFFIRIKKIFESTIIGDVFLNYTFEKVNSYAICIQEENGYEFINANTKTNLKRYIDELELDTKKLKEAQKIWKY